MECVADLTGIRTRRNQYDYRLYALVKERLQRVIGELPSFPERLAIFRKKLPQPATIPSPLAGEGQGGGKIGLYPADHHGKQPCEETLLPASKGNSSNPVEIIGCGLQDQKTGQPLKTVRHGQQVEVIVSVEIKEDIPSPIVGITVSNDKQEIVFAMNSLYITRPQAFPPWKRIKKRPLAFALPFHP